MALNEYSVVIELTKSPRTYIYVRYVQTPDMKNKGFFVKDMIHNLVITDNADNKSAVISTNMCHMIMDVMTLGLFSPLRVQIEHEVEKARREREGSATSEVHIGPFTQGWES